jgi:hypothetical protein
LNALPASMPSHIMNYWQKIINTHYSDGKAQPGVFSLDTGDRSLDGVQSGFGYLFSAYSLVRKSSY